MVSFSIERNPIENSMCDTGAYISIMSRANVDELGLSYTNKSIKLPYALPTKVIGIAYDLDVQMLLYSYKPFDLGQQHRSKNATLEDHYL